MATSPIVIRDFRPADAAAILEIQLVTPEMAQWHQGDYENLSRRSGGVVLVAESDEPAVIVGFLAALSVGGEAEIQNLAVRVGQRRLGVAQTLLEETHRRLAAQGVTSVFLEVRPSNLAARSLYRRFGYSECGLRRGYYVSDGEDALVLRLRLSAAPAALGARVLPF